MVYRYLGWMNWELGMLNRLAAVFSGAVLAFATAGAALAAGPMSVTTDFPAPVFVGDPFRTNLASIGVGVELASPTFVDVLAPTELTFRLLESRVTDGLEITSLTVGGSTYAINAQAFSPTGTLLGTQLFSGSFTGAVGFNDSIFGPDAPPVTWPDGFRVFIKSSDEPNLTGIGPFIGGFETLYFSVGDTALFEVTSISPIPEPSAWALMIVGFGAVGAVIRSSRRRSPAPA